MQTLKILYKEVIRMKNPFKRKKKQGIVVYRYDGLPIQISSDSLAELQKTMEKQRKTYHEFYHKGERCAASITSSL